MTLKFDVKAQKFNVGTLKFDNSPRKFAVKARFFNVKAKIFNVKARSDNVYVKFVQALTLYFSPTVQIRSETLRFGHLHVMQAKSQHRNDGSDNSVMNRLAGLEKFPFDNSYSI